MVTPPNRRTASKPTTLGVGCLGMCICISSLAAMLGNLTAKYYLLARALPNQLSPAEVSCLSFGIGAFAQHASLTCAAETQQLKLEMIG